jgi:hypothetical protein
VARAALDLWNAEGRPNALKNLAESPAKRCNHRHKGIILGGTFDHGDWSLQPNPEQTTGILETHAEIMKGLKQ